MKLLPVTLGVATLMIGMSSFAEMNIRISEDSTTVNGVETSLDDLWNNKNTVSSRSYSVNGQAIPLDSKNPKAIKKVGDNIKFEIFEIGENYTSHSLYSSGAGVCRAFVDGRGVELKDSSVYYIKNSATGDYYASIVGADVSKEGPKNIQYAPVFNIKNPALLEKIRKQEQQKGKKMVIKNIEERGEVLEDIICR